MKHILKNMLCTSLLLLAVVGCGKEEGSKSSSAAPASNYDQYMSQDSSQIFALYDSWYQTAEATNPGLGSYTAKKQTLVYNTAQTCVDKKVPIINLPYQSCSYNNTPAKTIVDLPFVVLPNQNLKSSNADLVSIATKENGGLIPVNARYENYNQAVFILEFIRTNGSRVAYKIDTRLHSSLNPVAKEELDSSKRTLITVY